MMSNIGTDTTKRRVERTKKKLLIRGRASKRRPPESSMPKKALKGSLPENVLTLAAFDAEAIPLILAKGVRPEHFESSVYRTLFERSIDYFKEYGRPAAGHLYDLVEDRLTSKRNSQVRMYIDALSDLYRFKDAVNRDFVIDQLGDFIDQQELRRTIIEAAEAIQRHDVAEAREYLRKERVGAGFNAAQRRAPRA